MLIDPSNSLVIIPSCSWGCSCGGRGQCPDFSGVHVLAGWFNPGSRGPNGSSGNIANETAVILPVVSSADPRGTMGQPTWQAGSEHSPGSRVVHSLQIKNISRFAVFVEVVDRTTPSFPRTRGGLDRNLFSGILPIEVTLIYQADGQGGGHFELDTAEGARVEGTRIEVQREARRFDAVINGKSAYDLDRKALEELAVLVDWHLNQR